MDIEGSEVNALKGAKNVIEKFKPDMAICLYHRDSDFYQIPEIVLDFAPSYKVWFGHHSDTFEDSIMYFSTKSPLLEAED